MKNTRLWPALALFVLPSLGCVGGPPVDESAPSVPAATTPVSAARGEQHGSVGAAEEGGESSNMLPRCSTHINAGTVEGPDTGPVIDSTGPDSPNCGGGPVGNQH